MEPRGWASDGRCVLEGRGEEGFGEEEDGVEGM